MATKIWLNEEEEEEVEKRRHLKLDSNKRNTK